MALFEGILIFDYPKANELNVFIWPIVYWAMLVIFDLIEAVVVEELTFGYYTLGFCPSLLFA